MVADLDSTATLTAATVAQVMGVTKWRVRLLCQLGRVVGARLVNNRWQIPTPVTIIEGHRPLKHRGGIEIVCGPTLPPLPKGRFRCHVIDPPWPIEKIARVVRPNQVDMDYTVMTLAEIERLPVPLKTEPSGAHLYLWTTQRHLPFALAMVNRWGYRYQCLMTWVKNGGMTPYSWQYNTEHVIFATIGDLSLNRLGLKLSFSGDRREHSRKPESFYDLVMKASPGPRMEWFGRAGRDGFVVWGDQAKHFDEL